MYCLEINNIKNDFVQKVLAQNYHIFRDHLLEYIFEIAYYELRSIEFK